MIEFCVVEIYEPKIDLKQLKLYPNLIFNGFIPIGILYIYAVSPIIERTEFWSSGIY